MALLTVCGVGCAGQEAPEPSETAIELPTPSPSETAEVLDLESMSDDELLAEAERAYQGFLDDVEEMRAGGGDDYLSLDEWTTEAFRESVQEIFDVHLPDGAVVAGAQRLLGIELSSEQPTETGRVQVNICLDNTTADYVDADGNDIKREDAPKTSTGSAVFVLSSDATRLLIDSETKMADVGDGLCGD